MKYFAHLCTAQDDDKFDLLFERHSFEGYGVYWWLCEHVGRRKKTANDSPEYLLNTARRRLERGMRVDKLLKIVHSLADFNLIEITEEPGWISVKIPKLNAYSAEWQKRLSKGNYGGTPESLPREHPSGLGREVLDVKILEEKRKKRSTPPSPVDAGVAPQNQEQITDEIGDPKARAEAMKTLKSAMESLNPDRKVVEPKASGNGKIPTAEGPEVDEMGERLMGEGFFDPLLQDVLNAWWAHKQGTHDVFVLSGALDNHGVKGHDRTRIYNTLGVV